MTDQELLLAISDIVAAQIGPVKQDIKDTRDSLHQEIIDTRDCLHQEIIDTQNSLHQEILDTKAELQQQITETRTELQQQITETRTELQQQITENQKEIRTTRQLLEENIQDTRKIKLCLETNVLPRLQNIEACYTSTYKRYVERIDQVDTIQRDVDLLKKVVSRHSKKLESLA